MKSSRTYRRKLVSESVKEKKRFNSLSGFRKKLREDCFVDENDNLIIEVVKNLGKWNWTHLRTERIPINEISCLGEIYDKTDTCWNDNILPTLYFNFDIHSIYGGETRRLNINYSDDRNISELFVEDNLCSYPLSSKLIREWLNKEFGLRSGYDNLSKWTKNTEIKFQKYVIETNDYFPILTNIPLGLKGIEVPLGTCII